MNYRIVIISGIFLSGIHSTIFPREIAKTNFTYLWEILIPGYNFYQQEEYVWGNFFMITRIVSLYSSVYYYKKFRAYQSLEKASRFADIYYGPGYSYLDPIKGGFKTTKEFSIEAGRSAAYMNISIALHIILTGIGLYKGYLDTVEDNFENSPSLLPSTKKNQIRLDYKINNTNLQGQTISFYFIIHPDF